LITKGASVSGVPKNRNLAEAASALLELVYHCTVRDVRTASGNASLGLAIVLIQNVALMLVMYFVYTLFGGLRAVAIRGDFVVYLVTGIFLLMTHNRTLNAVMKSGTATSSMMQHAPMTTIVSVAASALSVLYQQVMSGLIIYAAVHIWNGKFPLHDPAGLILPFLLSWTTGIAVGLIFKGLLPFAPRLVTTLARVYRIANMFTSGKLLPANYMGSQLLGWFIWNPLLHCIDQARGAAFVNYFPKFTSLTYPIWFSIGLILLGLMVDHWLRKNMSLSWGKR
jgi:ABC-type polysaccharide/polyol phosphate export permease